MGFEEILKKLEAEYIDQRQRQDEEYFRNVKQHIVKSLLPVQKELNDIALSIETFSEADAGTREHVVYLLTSGMNINVYLKIPAVSRSLGENDSKIKLKADEIEYLVKNLRKQLVIPSVLIKEKDRLTLYLPTKKSDYFYPNIREALLQTGYLTNFHEATEINEGLPTDDKVLTLATQTTNANPILKRYKEHFAEPQAMKFPLDKILKTTLGEGLAEVLSLKLQVDAFELKLPFYEKAYAASLEQAIKAADIKYVACTKDEMIRTYGPRFIVGEEKIRTLINRAIRRLELSRKPKWKYPAEEVKNIINYARLEEEKFRTLSTKTSRKKEQRAPKTVRRATGANYYDIEALQRMGLLDAKGVCPDKYDFPSDAKREIEMGHIKSSRLEMIAMSYLISKADFISSKVLPNFATTYFIITAAKNKQQYKHLRPIAQQLGSIPVVPLRNHRFYAPSDAYNFIQISLDKLGRTTKKRLVYTVQGLTDFLNKIRPENKLTANDIVRYCAKLNEETKECLFYEEDEGKKPIRGKMADAMNTFISNDVIGDIAVHFIPKRE